MTTKHTPGPWRAVIRSNQLGIRSVAVDMAPTGAWVRSNDRTVPTERDAANARLIAAAPDLLAALHLAVEYIPQVNKDVGSAEIALLEAVIAKAEGR